MNAKPTLPPIEIEMPQESLQGLLRALPEETLEALKREALRRRVPLRDVIAEGIRKVAGEFAASAAA